MRRVSQKVVTSLFDLNPATLTLLLRAIAKPLQEAANKILSVYVKVRAGEGGEEGSESAPQTVSRGDCALKAYNLQIA